MFRNSIDTFKLYIVCNLDNRLEVYQKEVGKAVSSSQAIPRKEKRRPSLMMNTGSSSGTVNTTSTTTSRLAKEVPNTDSFSSNGDEGK